MVLQNDQKSQKRDLIIQAAARVFAQKGFAGTIMADIAEEAGIGKGTIYEYFESKEDLFFAVFEWFTQELTSLAMVSVSTLGGTASERLMTLGESLVKAGMGMEDMFSLSMEFWAASVSSQMKNRFKEVFKQVYMDFRRIISALIRDGIERGEFRPDVDPESLAAVLVGSWDGLLLQAWFDPAFDPLSTARNFMSVIIKGLRANPSQERQGKTEHRKG